MSERETYELTDFGRLLLTMNRGIYAAMDRREKREAKAAAKAVKPATGPQLASAKTQERIRRLAEMQGLL